MVCCLMLWHHFNFFSFQLIFEGIVGRGYQSDIAIDEVTIVTCGGGGGSKYVSTLLPLFTIRMEKYCNY